MADECASVSIKYKGNGTQVLFTFPFTYMNVDDVVAFVYDEEEKLWVNQENRFVFECLQLVLEHRLRQLRPSQRLDCTTDRS